MSVIALSLLGLMGLALVFDTSDGTDEDEAFVDGEQPDEEDTNVPPEEVPAEESPDAEDLPPEVVRLEGSAIAGLGPEFEQSTVVGTQGDDVITQETITSLLSGADASSFLVAMDLGAGDDFVEAGAIDTSDVTVEAGAGNDTIENDSDWWAELRGGDGNDVLTSDRQAALYGDAGDDTLAMDVGSSSFDGAVLSGGDGVDVLQVRHTLGEDNGFDNATTGMFGGAGSDDFGIELIDGVGPTSNTQGEMLTLGSDNAQVQIGDFVAGEDALTVDVSSFTEDGKYALTDVALGDADVPSSWAEGNWYSLSLSFAGTGEVGDFSTQIFILSDEGGVTLDDINILSGVAV